MKESHDVGKLIIRVLSEKKMAVDADYMAYLTGSTITQVIEEGEKLQELGLINITDMKLQLKEEKGYKFSNWDRLKKK